MHMDLYSERCFKLAPSVQELIIEVIPSNNGIKHLRFSNVTKLSSLKLRKQEKEKCLYKSFIDDFTVNILKDYPQPSYTPWHICKSGLYLTVVHKGFLFMECNNRTATGKRISCFLLQYIGVVMCPHRK
jgi:hypothetical protein